MSRDIDRISQVQCNNPSHNNSPCITHFSIIRTHSTHHYSQTYNGEFKKIILNGIDRGRIQQEEAEETISFRQTRRHRTFSNFHIVSDTKD